MVAVGADRDIQASIRTCYHALGPVPIGWICRQGHDPFAWRVDTRDPGCIRKSQQGIRVGDVKITVQKRHAERRGQSIEQDAAHLCLAVPICIAQQADAVGARHLSPGDAHDLLLDERAQPLGWAGLPVAFGD